MYPSIIVAIAYYNQRLKSVRKEIEMRILALLAAVWFGTATQVLAQDPKDVKEELANNPKLFLKVAVKAAKWTEPAEPTKIVGPIHFVGTKGLGVWLITTSEGHILMNTGMPGSGPMIEASIKKLGFKMEDIKLLLACHPHIDHVGAHAYIKKACGAKVVMMREGVELFESGGKLDFHYGEVPDFAYETVKTDRMIQDEDTVKLGDVTLTALLTQGHCKGATTWTMKATECEKTYTVVFPDGSGVNPGYRVAKNPSYLEIGDDYRRTLRILEKLKPDIWLGAHTESFDFEGKRTRSVKEGAKAWVDPDGYQKWVAGQRKTFEATVKAEMDAPAKGK
jgi:metallo-beta-lactamase class B